MKELCNLKDYYLVFQGCKKVNISKNCRFRYEIYLFINNFCNVGKTNINDIQLSLREKGRRNKTRHGIARGSNVYLSPFY